MDNVLFIGILVVKAYCLHYVSVFYLIGVPPLEATAGMSGLLCQNSVSGVGRDVRRDRMRPTSPKPINAMEAGSGTTLVTAA